MYSMHEQTGEYAIWFGSRPFKIAFSLQKFRVSTNWRHELASSALNMRHKHGDSW